MFQMMLIPFMGFMTRSIVEEGGGGSGTSEGEEKLLAKIKEQNKSLVEQTIKDFNAKMDEQSKTFLTEKDAEKIKSDFAEALKGMDTKALASYVETITGLKEQVKNATTAAEEVREIVRKQGLELKSMGENKIPDVRRKLSRESQIKALVVNAFASKEFQDFESRGFKGASNKMYLDQAAGKIELKEMTTKATVDTSSHTGVVMISEISDIVRDDVPTRMSHVRDIINVGMTDQAQVVAGQVYDFTDALTLGAIMLAENGEAPESVFKSKENTWTLKRIANSMRLSKREIKVNGLQWVIDKVMAKLPDALLFVEDVQLLFGDGVGNNVKGLANEAQAFDLANNAYVGTSFASVATYNAGAQILVTFAAAHNLKNGDNLTIADATETTYNATHESVEVINATQVIVDVAYIAEADTSAWTGYSTSPFYLSIDGAQEVDVLAVSDAILEAGEYSVSGHIIHPSMATKMGLLKNTQNDYLNISKDGNGKVTGVNGKPIITTTAMPFGKFISGDFTRNGLELKEFTPLNLQFVEDVESVKKNEIVVVIEEEIIFPVYNPYWFIYGKFSTAKAQLETS
jgi:hypothetical protein